MTASANIKTPAMTLPLLAGTGAAALAQGSAARATATRIARTLNPLPLSDLLDGARPDGGIVVTEELRRGGALGQQQQQQQAQWVREYRVRLYVADREAVSSAFGLSFQSVAAAVGAAFVPALLRALAADQRRAVRATGGGKAKDDDGDAEDPAAAGVVGLARVRGERAAAAAAADDDEGGGEERRGADDGEPPKKAKGGKAKAPAGGRKAARGAPRPSAGEDLSDGEDAEDGGGADDEDGEPAAADGTLRSSTRGQVRGYDDADAGALEDDDDDKAAADDAASDASGAAGGSSDDDDEEEGFRRKKKRAAPAAKKKAAGAAAVRKKGGAVVAGAVAVMDLEDDDDEEEDSGAAAEEEEEDAGSAAAAAAARDASVAEWIDKAARVFRVAVPAAVSRHRSFGGVIASELGAEVTGAPGKAAPAAAAGSPPWVELSIVTPAAAAKLLMLAAAERAVSSALVQSFRAVGRAVALTARLSEAGAQPGGQPEERVCVATEGVNLAAVWGLAAETAVPRRRPTALQPPAGSRGGVVSRFVLEPVLDTRRLYTNDVAAILRTYGVEAARAAIVREVRPMMGPGKM